MAKPTPLVAASLGADPVQQATINTESVADPGVISILALSVAAITLVRRRARQ